MMTIYDCGCSIAHNDNSASISYCSKHGAAPDLLRALIGLAEDVNKQMLNPSHHRPYHLTDVEQAIEKATL